MVPQLEVTLALANYPITAFHALEAWKVHTRYWVQQAVDAGAQLLVFPEYGAMELSSLLSQALQRDLQGQIAAMQEMLPDFIGAFQQLSREFGCWIVAPSFPVLDHGRMVNRAYVFGPGGYSYQDKWNMTRFENETWNIQHPEHRFLTVFQTPWGSFGVQICYDIEFPGAGAALAGAGCHLIVAPSCTETLHGATRVHIGARARALEQQMFVGVSQTCGHALWSPAVDINYGFAAVYCPPDGLFPPTGIVKEGPHQHEGWTVQTLDLREAAAVRSSGQVFNFKDYRVSEGRIEGEVGYCRL